MMRQITTTAFVAMMAVAFMTPGFSASKKKKPKSPATGASAVPPQHRFASFDHFLGDWDCKGDRSEYVDGKKTTSRVMNDHMVFKSELQDQWVKADYQDADGYVNRCYYTQVSGQNKYEQVCISSQEGITTGEATALSPSKIEFTGETKVKNQVMKHFKSIERVAMGALDFYASLEIPETHFKREWKGLCFYRKASLATPPLAKQ